MSKHKKHKHYKPDDIDESKVNSQYNPQLNNMGLNRLANIMGNIDINKLAELLNNFNFNNDIESANNNINSETTYNEEKTYDEQNINEDVKHNRCKVGHDKIHKNSTTILANNEGIMVNEDKIEKLLLILKDIADQETSRDLQKLLELYLSK